MTKKLMTPTESVKHSALTQLNTGCLALEAAMLELAKVNALALNTAENKALNYAYAQMVKAMDELLTINCR